MPWASAAGVLYTDLASAPRGAPFTAFCADGTRQILTWQGKALRACGVPLGLGTHEGRMWYVALDGDDARCMPDAPVAPCRTVNALVQQGRARPGDVIYVRAGRYLAADAANGWAQGSFIRPAGGGEPGRPIAVLAHPGEHVEVILDRRYRLFGHYETLRDFTVAGFRVVLANGRTGNVVMVGVPVSVSTCRAPAKARGRAERVRIVALEIDGEGRGGMASGSGGDLIEVGTSEGAQVLGNHLHDMSPGNPREPTHAIYLSAPQRGTEIGWNRIEHIPHSRALIQLHQDRFGGACWGGEQISGVRIHDNVIDDVAGQALLLDGGVGAVEVARNVISRVHRPGDHRYADVIALRGSGGALRLDFHDNVLRVNPNAHEAGWVFGLGKRLWPACPHSVTLTRNVIELTGPPGDTFVHREPWCSRTPLYGSGNRWIGAPAPALRRAP